MRVDFYCSWLDIRRSFICVFAVVMLGLVSCAFAADPVTCVAPQILNADATACIDPSSTSSFTLIQAFVWFSLFIAGVLGYSQGMKGV